MPKKTELPVIKVVGTSGSGKSTLVRSLRTLGYNARPVSQEHSDVPDLWQHFGRPWILLYLHVDLEALESRRPDVARNKSHLRQETRRLDYAREQADMRINTTAMTPEQVLAIALSYLKQTNTRHSDEPLPPLPATGTVASE